MEEDLGSGELSEWKAYYRIEPFGQERDNLHAAYICSVIANYSGKLKTSINIDEFMFMHEETRRNRETGKTLSMMNIMAKKNV